MSLTSVNYYIYPNRPITLNNSRWIKSIQLQKIHQLSSAVENLFPIDALLRSKQVIYNPNSRVQSGRDSDVETACDSKIAPTDGQTDSATDGSTHLLIDYVNFASLKSMQLIDR